MARSNEKLKSQKLQSPPQEEEEEFKASFSNKAEQLLQRQTEMTADAEDSDCALMPITDSFRTIVDPHTKKNLKVVPPYWKILETDVKLRWRGKTLFSVLQEEFRSRPPQYYAQALERKNFFRVNGLECDSSTVLRNGDKIFHRTLEVEFAISAEDAITVVYEDAEILAVYKPSSIPTYPQGRYTKASLLNIIKTSFSAESYLHPVNRLDRVTAGLIFFAKTPTAARALTSALPSAVKLYVAEVKGDFSNIIKEVKAAQRERESVSTEGLRHEREQANWSFLADGSQQEIEQLFSQQKAALAKEFSINEWLHQQCTDQETRQTGVKQQPHQVELMQPLQKKPQKPDQHKQSQQPKQQKRLDSHQQQHSDARYLKHQGDSQQGKKVAAQRGGDQSEEMSVVDATESRRAIRRLEKRLAKEERRSKRLLAQEERETLNQKRMQKIMNPVSEQRLTVKDAAHQGYIGFEYFPGCPACNCKPENQRRSAYELWRNKSSISVNSPAREEQQRMENSQSLCCCADWLSVTARLRTGSAIGSCHLVAEWSEEEGKDANTLFRHLSYDAESNTSLIACYPRTGRTHQIRKHLQILGNSTIVGDVLYGRGAECMVDSEKPAVNVPTNLQMHIPEMSNSQELTLNTDLALKVRRSSKERTVDVTFSMEDVRAANRHSLHCCCHSCSALISSDSNILDGKASEGTCQKGVDTPCKFVEELRTVERLLGLQVSPSGEWLDLPYIVEEPSLIHLFALCYGFDLTPALQSSYFHKNDAPNSAEPEESPAEKLSHVNLPYFCAEACTSPPICDVSTEVNPRPGINAKYIFVNCPLKIWPQWAKRAAVLLQDMRLLQCLRDYINPFGAGKAS